MKVNKVNNIHGKESMLTPRLECIVNHVNADTAADIGTDHAYVSIELIKQNRAQRVIASDVRVGPLGAAAKNIEKNGLSDKIETRLGSGLSILKQKEADVIIIAGMGGELISDILENDRETVSDSKLILQPMNAQYELRKYLLNNGFKILSEDIECEGHRVYNLMVAQNGKQRPFETDIEYHLPKCLYSHPKFSELLAKKQREFLKIIRGLENSKNCDVEKLEYFKSCYENSERIRNEVK